MSKRSDAYLQGIPTKPYDLLREGLIVLGIVAVIIILLASIFGSPDYPTVRSEDVARTEPVAYLETSVNILAGNSDLQSYGPPYTSDTANAQEVLGVAPAKWFGATIPIDPPRDFVINPLKRAAVLDKDLTQAIGSYTSASSDQQSTWLGAYLASLKQATLKDGQVQIPDGDYGPVAVMMQGMLELGQAGLLEGALESSDRLPYTLNFTRSLLFFQDDIDHNVAEKLDMLGEQWGISHETGNFPGAWWLWPYTFLYQIPPMSDSPNGDLQVAVIMIVVFLALAFLPFIPILNHVPRWVRVYRIIWRDWYTSREKPESGGNKGPDQI
jgi:hypothetical protein